MTTDSALAYVAEHFPVVLAALPVAAAVIIGGIVLNFVLGRALLLVARRNNLSGMDVHPVQRLLRWLITLVTALLVAGIFGFQLGGVWAFLSATFAMIAIGFVAMWSLISHTSATVLLLFTRPFQVGDHIELKSENIAGRVLDLNFFFTTLRVDEHTTYQVPNNLFFQKVTRRVAGPYLHSLSQQLSSPYPAKLPPFPHPITNPDDKPKPAA